MPVVFFLNYVIPSLISNLEQFSVVKASYLQSPSIETYAKEHNFLKKKMETFFIHKFQKHI